MRWIGVLVHKIVCQQIFFETFHDIYIGLLNGPGFVHLNDFLFKSLYVLI